MIGPPTPYRSSELVAADPFDESHRLRQARALYRAGRANDALATLREFRDELAEELGLDPSPDPDVLEQAMLRHAPGLDGARRVRGYIIGERLGRGAAGSVHAARRPGQRAWELRLDPDRWEEQACTAAGRNLTRAEWTAHLGDEPYRRTCPQLPASD
jgi:hypothetical protein